MIELQKAFVDFKDHVIKNWHMASDDTKYQIAVVALLCLFLFFGAILAVMGGF